MRPELLGLLLIGAPLLGCKPKVETNLAEQRAGQNRFRPVPDPPGEIADIIVDRIPNATWDDGLARATSLLVGASFERTARLTPAAVQDAKSLAGYPGHARFVKRVNQGALPEDLIEELTAIALSKPWPVDVAIARRDYSDGLTLWIGGISHRPVLLDPINRDLALDDRLPVSIEPTDVDADTYLLFVAPPMGTVEVFELTPLVALWVDRFHVPGTYRMEVVAQQKQDSSVVLLWTQHVDSPPAELAQLSAAPAEVQSPIDATEQLYAELNTMRADAGLAPVERFQPFEPLAREHAALMAAHGTLGHTIRGVSSGVANKARMQFRPEAKHYENVAAALTWQEALDLVALSPGHRMNLLCESCTHASIGVALEPTRDVVPRLFVVWELLEFPAGEPRTIERYDQQ